jgi:hypothetical protein
MRILLFLFSLLLASNVQVIAQNYHAVHGSSHAGSLGVMNNPASILAASSPWDINLLSMQAATSTNAVTVLNYSLLSSPYGSQYRINKGEFGRYANGNYNIHLLNARIALNRRNAIAFGANLRGYLNIHTNRYNFLDTIKNLRNFLRSNESNTNLQGELKTSNWIEVFGTYSHTLWDEETSRLNAGVSVKATRGLAGGSAGLSGTGFSRIIQNNRPYYFIKAGNFNYAYSSTLDRWAKGRSASENIKELVVSAQGGVSMDLGFEYLVKSQAVTNFYDDDSYYDYEWKIGISLLDLGVTNYRYSGQSRTAANPKANLSDSGLQRKFNRLSSVQSFNDSIATVFTGLQSRNGFFNIINPTRLVVNVDRYLFDDFYVNGELSANLASLAGSGKIYTSEISLLTITPRWETRRFGLYLPVQFNAEQQLWIGGAFKAGPLLAGVHNLGYIFSKKQIQSGGGYLALVLRPGNNLKNRRDGRNNCPN